MSPFVGEIRMVGFNFAPVGWAICNGQILPISANTALFSLLGTTYGGDGKSTFGLPNLQGSAPMHAGNGPGLTPRVLGEVSGTPTVTLLTSELAAHTHQVNSVASAATQASPVNHAWASSSTRPFASASVATNATMSPQALQNTGGSQPHNNIQPYLVVNFIVAMQGVFPPRG